MYPKQLFLLLFLFLASAFVNGQVKSEKLDLSNEYSIKSLPVTDSLSVYHRKGQEIEKSFQQSDLKNDGQLETREFIIERTPNIKIEYKPASRLSVNKNK